MTLGLIAAVVLAHGRRARSRLCGQSQMRKDALNQRESAVVDLCDGGAECDAAGRAAYQDSDQATIACLPGARRGSIQCCEIRTQLSPGRKIKV